MHIDIYEKWINDEFLEIKLYIKNVLELINVLNTL